MRRWMLLALAACLFSVGPALGQDVIVPERVSLIALIANPTAYAGHRVRVVGYLSLEFENCALYVSKADFEANAFENAIWVDTTLWRDRHVASRLSRRYVVAEGVVTAERYAYSGGLTKVTRLEVRESRAEFYERMDRMRWASPEGRRGIILILLVPLATFAVYRFSLRRRH